MNAKTKELSGEVIERDPPTQSRAVSAQQRHEIATETPSEAAALISMIDRAARDDAVNIDKMRELLAMRKEIKAQEAQDHFDAAMSAAQAEMRTVVTDKDNSQTRSRYASLAAIDLAIRSIYTKHGFVVTFDTGEAPKENEVRMLALVANSGHRQNYHIDMPADGKGAKGNDVMTKTHATGSAVTYGRRNLLSMIFNLSFGSDDDGNKAGRKPKEQITDEAADTMRDTVRALVTEMKMPIENFLKWAKAESISDIPAGDLKDVIANLQERKRKLAEKKGAAQ